MTRSNAKSIGLLLLTVLAGVPGEASEVKTHSTSNWISPDYTEIELLREVYGLILTQSVEVPDQRKLIKGAINGMLASLDPHSSYLDPKEMKEFNVETGGKFGGIGLEVTMKTESPK